MLALRDALRSDNARRLRAIDLAGKTSIDGAAPELAALFLGVWAEVSMLCRRLDEAETLVRKARSLVRTDIPPEIDAYVRVQEASAFSWRGRTTEAEASLRRALDTLSPRSARRPLYALVLARFLANAGRETEIDREVVAIADQVGTDCASAALYARFVQLVETCRLDEAGQIAPRIDLSNERIAFLKNSFAGYSRLLAFLQSRQKSAPGGRPLTNGEAPFEPVLAALLGRDAPEALRLSREEESKAPRYSILRANFLAFNMLRAELACGNVEAARRILAQRRELGNVHYLDHLFLARIEMLSGNADAAARFFATARRLCARYQAEARLVLEMRMACEISPDAAMELTLRSTAVRAAAAGPIANPRTGAAARSVRLLGGSPAMEALREAIGKMAPLDVPVLITGQTGTGKDLAARALHEQSPRRGSPFVAVNCGAISESLLESELFGHAKGAFTGAEREHRGIFEEAADGTVLLDEIGEMPLGLQVALLRVLESGEIRPVGASRPRRVSCRILAATNADLAGRVRARRFREDLFFRLHRLDLAVPTLRSRGRDVLELAAHFLAEGRPADQRPTMSADLERALMARDWPGNVRELRNVIERMRLMNSDKLAYGVSDLEPSTREQPESGPAATAAPAVGEIPAERSLVVRMRRLRELFGERKELRAVTVVRLLHVSSVTATRDLRTLCAEGFIEKVMPNASPRSHYFRLRSTSP